MKKLASLLLCVSLLFGLAACTTNGEAEQDPILEYGRYVETDITPEGFNGYIYDIQYGEDGRIDLIGYNMANEGTGWENIIARYTSKDGGKSWVKDEMEWLRPYMPKEDVDLDNREAEEPYVGNLMLLSGGRLVAEVGTLYTEDYTTDTQFYIIDESGEMLPFDMPVLGELQDDPTVDAYLQNLIALPNNRLLLSVYQYSMSTSLGGGVVSYGSGDSNTIRGIYDMDTGEMVTDLSAWEGWEYFESGQHLYLSNWDDYVVVDKETAQIVPSVSVPSSMDIRNANPGAGGMNMSLMADSAGTFYSIDENGIFKIDNETYEATELLPGLNYTFGSPMAYVADVQVGGEGAEGYLDFYVQVGIDGQDYRLLYYSYDPEAPARSDQHISVYSLYNSRTVRLALGEYARLHPEVSVSYEYSFESQYYYDDEAMTLEDALSALNTRLLGGTGPDVLILDGLPFEGYIQRGVLEDISDLTEGRGLIDALVNPLYDSDGKLFMIPTRFTLPMLFGEKGYIEQFTSLEAVLAEVEALPGVEPLEQIDWESATEEEMNAYWEKREAPVDEEDRVAVGLAHTDNALQMLYDVSAPFIYSDSTGINRDNLGKMLEATKRLSDHYDLASDLSNNMTGGSGYSGMSYSFDLHAALANFTEGKSTIGYTNVTTFEALGEASVMNQRMFWMASDEERENMEFKDVAAILAPGLEGNVYSPILLAGVCYDSPQKELAKDFVAAMLNDDVQLYDLGEGFPVTRVGFDGQYEKYRARDRYMAEMGITYIEPDFDAFFAQDLQPAYENTYLYGVISAAAEPYLRGESSLDDALNQILSETEMYFAERQ